MRKNYKDNRPPISILKLSEEVRGMYTLSHETGDKEVARLCRELVNSKDEYLLLSEAEKEAVVRQIFCSLRCELEILQDMADDPDISEIMINGKDNVFYEKHGRIFRSDLSFETDEQLEGVIQRLAAKVGREMNDLNPIVDARLSNGSRVNAVHSRIAIDGPVLTIRKFNTNRMNLDDLISQGSLSEAAAQFLVRLVSSAYNIFISGGTSSGKTTFLNVMTDYIPSNERIIVIEDSAELQVRGHDNLVRMEAKPANAQGKGSVSIRDLIKTSLRMRPDRIIVGEVRGDEVIDMLAAMSTGHDGSLSTGHANSPSGMIGRLESLMIAGSGFPIESVRSQIAEAIEIIVQLCRTSDGVRRVEEITEVTGYSGGVVKLNPLFVYKIGEGLVPTGNTLQRTRKLELYDAVQHDK